MKTKIITVLLLTIFSITSFGQIIGVDISKAEKVNDASKIVYEKLLYHAGSYAIMFKPTVIGYKHAIEKMYKLCSKNNLSFLNPQIKNDIFIPSYIDNMFDYSAVHNAISAEKAEIKKIWVVSENWLMSLSCEKNSYLIIFIEVTEKSKKSKKRKNNT